ncbi:MAG: ABC transporter ATP-binding protein/permease [Chitinophagaceae bacterium]|nr:ABC transporter ATP-binding protein/permease [Chitinophagaceae bacterium]
MDYNLNKEHKSSTRDAFSKMMVFLREERKSLTIAFVLMLANSGITMLTPYLIGYTIDHYIVTKMYRGLILFSGILLGIYLTSSVTEYLQIKIMGTVGQRVLYSLRNAVFNKIQTLPVKFFNQNKAGDLISRINNDTDSVNRFFSQSLMQFIDNIFLLIATAVFLLVINPKLGSAALAPAIIIIVFVKLVNPLVRRKNAVSLKKFGLLSGEIQENLANFKTIIAFSRRDFFRKKIEEANNENYKASIIAGLANGLYEPVFTLCGNIAQLTVLSYGIYLIIHGNFTVGLLISYIAYTNAFYRPLRQIASLWAGFQTTMAAWDRISVILNMDSDLVYGPNNNNLTTPDTPLLSFHNVSFQYQPERKILSNINLELDRGKTYAFVGPTGGGKTTTASLIARLYDADTGEVKLNGTPIREFTASVLSRKIGFILQEPFLFDGTLRDNIVFGNEELQDIPDQDIYNKLRNDGFEELIKGFEDGLNTKIEDMGESMSLGQKQIIAFIRAVLRNPDLLILDEATANIDTVTEQQLQMILDKLPEKTTKVIIAHRLNTIANADQIFFVNDGRIENAGSIDHALRLLMENKRES